MMRAGINLFLLLPIYITSLIVGNLNIDYKKINNSVKKIDEFKGGSLEEHNGFKVLFISGSNYEMGLQYGHFLKEEYLKNRRAWHNFCEKNLKISNKDLQDTWDKISNYIPHEYIEEMQGRADALGLLFKDVALVDAIGVFASKISGCSIMAAWGPATSDGELYHLRSQDFALEAVIDPVTGTTVYDNSLIVIRKPDNGFVSIFPHSPGELGVEGGFNEKGICLGWSDSPCKDQIVDGIPIIIRQLMALDRASNLDESIKILNSNRNISCNMIISDAKKTEAVVLEQSANHSYVGAWDNPVESTGRYWTIDSAVRRTNFFIDKSLADTQEGLYNHRNFYWPFIPIFRHYVALSKGINQNWAKLNLNKTMSMLRSVYRGETDFLFKVGKKVIRKEVFNQWVACPKTGDLLFSFASNKKSAYESQVFYVNLFQLLGSKPK